MPRHLSQVPPILGRPPSLISPSKPKYPTGQVWMQVLFLRSFFPTKTPRHLCEFCSVGSARPRSGLLPVKKNVTLPSQESTGPGTNSHRTAGRTSGSSLAHLILCLKRRLHETDFFAFESFACLLSLLLFYRPAAVTMRITAGCAHLKKRWCTKAFFHSTAPPPNRGSGLDPTLPLQSRNSHQDNGKHIDLLHPSTGICCTPWWKGILVKLQCSESCKLLNLASLASKN